MSTTVAIDARESGTTTGRYVDKLIEYLHILQPEYKIMVLTKPHRLDYFERIAPNFEVLPAPYKEFTFAEQLGFRKQLSELKPDLVHFSIVQQPVWYTGKVVTTMQDLTTARFKNPSKNPVVFAFKQQVYKWVNKKVVAKSAALIAPSQYVAQDVVNFTHVDPAKITVTYEGADIITEAPEALTELIDKPFIMYIGRPMPHKNLERLIDAFVLLQATHPNLQLVLAGKKDANYQRIEQSVHAKDISNILFTDFISEGQLRWLYEHCAAYIFPSLSEGFGLPGLEAMAHGAPVVSSNATCLPEIYGTAAHYFDPLNVPAMATAINEVLIDSALRAKLVIAGHAQVKKYSWQQMAEQTLGVYERALKT
ncbi:MAG TPA: glycosyltransferase family 1 protein [Candidatus Saccharimonadales bacterium]|nr:glycosyltransferase family 1 protein [Candidatus Saccharimonadales bacterium]